MSVWDTCLQITVVCTVVGAWVGAFPIPLDWDRPWQVSHCPLVFNSLHCKFVRVKLLEKKSKRDSSYLHGGPCGPPRTCVHQQTHQTGHAGGFSPSLSPHLGRDQGTTCQVGWTLLSRKLRLLLEVLLWASATMSPRPAPMPMWVPPPD